MTASIRGFSVSTLFILTFISKRLKYESYLVILKLVLLIVIAVLDGFTEREPVVLALIVLTSFDSYLYVLTIHPLIYSVDEPTI